MNKPEDFSDNFDRSAKLNSTDQDKLLSGFDKKRRSFLKKLLISAAYITPVILSFSIRDIEAKGPLPIPTRRKR